MVKKVVGILKKIRRKLFRRKPYLCCFNFDNTLIASAKKPTRIAGVMGYVKANNAHLGIAAALNDGMQQIILFTCIDDPLWYFKTIEPIIVQHPDKIKYAGCIKDKQKIYDAISDVYDLSSSKVSAYIKNECQLTGTIYHG